MATSDEITALTAITDPTERAKAANQAATAHETAAHNCRRIRDDAIRTRKASGTPMQEIAEDLGLSFGTIRGITR